MLLINKMDCCSNCHSHRFLNVSGVINNLFFLTLDNIKIRNNITSDINIGHNDNLHFKVCADCGYIPGKWPLRKYILGTESQSR